MANPNSGFGSLFSNYSQNNTQQRESSLFTPVRVVDIILDDSHPNFKEHGGWDSIGLVKFRPVYLLSNENEDQFLFARPLLPNIKHYPLKNEVVFILFLPDKSTLNNNNGNFYYLDAINIWSSTHHNALPDVDNPSNFTENQKRDYIETSGGASRRITDNSSEINLGKTFKEKSDIKPLLPFEGDTIVEGRWGHSIRLGSTVNNSNIPNPWSSTGNNGDPIIIIRNNSFINSKEGWIPSLEDVNRDGTSVYITSTQSIPIQVASTNQASFGSNINNVNPQNIKLNDTPLITSVSQSNSTLDNNITQTTQSIQISSTPEVITTTDSLSNTDQMDFILPGDVVEMNAEKELEDAYFVPDDLDISIPENTNADLNPVERYKPGQFIRPAAGKITSKKELRKDPTNPSRTEYHGGLDIANKTGTPVYASAPGKVVRANFSPSYGNVVIIYHADKNLYSLYAHLSLIKVSVGQNVDQGAIIGKIGTTGKSTGPHLHFEIIQGTNFGNNDFYSKTYKQDPLNYI